MECPLNKIEGIEDINLIRRVSLKTVGTYRVPWWNGNLGHEKRGIERDSMEYL